MDYSVQILEEELKRLQKIANKFDYNSTTSHINIVLLNNISDLKKAIAIINKEKPIRIIYK